MKAVIFDFDGVVIDSQYHWDCFAPAHLQQILPSWTRDKSSLLKGLNNEGCYRVLTEDHGLTVEFHDFVRHVHEFSHQVYHRDAAPTAGLFPLLERLNALTDKPSIASAGHKQWIETAMSRLNLYPHFAHVTTSEEVARSKPSPDVYLLAADKIGRAPADCLVIEDTNVGLAASKAAGMTVIAFHPAGQDWQEMTGADHHIDHFDTLTADRLASFLQQ